MVVHARRWTPVPPLNLHGKEGVDGSSPSEGSAKDLQNGVCLRESLETPHALVAPPKLDRHRDVPTVRLIVFTLRAP